MFQILKKYVSVQAVSGREEKLSQVIEEAVSPYVDSVRRDATGNLIAFKKGSDRDAKKLMFAAHMDEIGFLTTFICENGMIRVAPVGGISFVSAAFTHVVFENGTKGVLVTESGTKPEEINGDNILVDIGAQSRKEAEKRVFVGERISTVPSLEKLAKKRVCGRPIDNRIGCAVMTEALRKIVDCKNDTYFVFTAQEEVGLRGSRPAAFGIMPDFGVAVDVCSTGDAEGDKFMNVKLGGGAAVKVKDASVLSDAPFVETIVGIAKKRGIKHQMEILIKGGTDAASMQLAGSGAAVSGISIPTRYIHSSVETVDLEDAEAAAELIAALAETSLK